MVQVEVAPAVIEMLVQLLAVCVHPAWASSATLTDPGARLLIDLLPVPTRSRNAKGSCSRKVEDAVAADCRLCNDESARRGERVEGVDERAGVVMTGADGDRAVGRRRMTISTNSAREGVARLIVFGDGVVAWADDFVGT
jgi:hypothetical protein